MTSAPRFTPSSLNCTPATLTLSVAVAATVIVPLTVAPETGALIETVGAMLSFATVTLTGAAVPMFQAASRATAVRVCAPFAADLVSQDMT